MGVGPLCTRPRNNLSIFEMGINYGLPGDVGEVQLETLHD